MKSSLSAFGGIGTTLLLLTLGLMLIIYKLIEIHIKARVVSEILC